MKFVLPDEGNVWQEIEIINGECEDEFEIKIQTFEKVGDVVDRNARQRNTGARTYLGEGDNTSMVLIGSLSALKAHQLMKDGTFFDDDRLRRWFKDLDNYLWGTMRGTTDRRFSTTARTN